MKIRVWKSILISGEAGEDNNNNNINETKYVGGDFCFDDREK